MENLENYKYGFYKNYYDENNFYINKNIENNNNILITDYLFCYNSINIIKLRPDIKDNNYLMNPIYDKLSYLDYFYNDNIIKNGITHIIINFIDRGIVDYIAFSNMLNELYQKLEILEFEQNYSLSNNNIKNEFLYFIKNLKCKKLYIKDRQSYFLYSITNDDLFNVMNENLIIIIKITNKEDYLIKDEKRNNNIIKIFDDTNLEDY